MFIKLCDKNKLYLEREKRQKEGGENVVEEKEEGELENEDSQPNSEGEQVVGT